MKRMFKLLKYQRQIALVGLVFLSLLTTTARAQLGFPPVIAVQPVGTGVNNGGSATITATVLPSTSTMNFYWFLNGRPVTNSNVTVVNAGLASTLTINNFTTANAGIYSLRVTNGVGSVTSSNATMLYPNTVVSNTLTVVEFVYPGTGMTTTGYRMQISGPAGSNVVVQASTDLKNWTAISTNFLTNGVAACADATAKNRSLRFYRAVVR